MLLAETTEVACCLDSELSVDAGVARPLVEGLSAPTTVTDSSGAQLVDVHPMPFMDALRTALDEDHEAPAPAG